MPLKRRPSVYEVLASAAWLAAALRDPTVTDQVNGPKRGRPRQLARDIEDALSELISEMELHDPELLAKFRQVDGSLRLPKLEPAGPTADKAGPSQVDTAFESHFPLTGADGGILDGVLHG
jgi:hypothetical protein